MFPRFSMRVRAKHEGLAPLGFEGFQIPSSEAPRLAAQMEGDLSRLFFASEGRLVHKWLHYLTVYERHFAAYRHRPVHMLEIGVSQGGSLDLWRRYFGNDAVIFGIDVDPACAGRVEPPNQVRIGSQDDEDFLRRVADEMGRIDIVLDDGSHIGRHQIATFRTLFPLLEPGGLYVIEDLHTSYWEGLYEGGYRKQGTGIEFIKQMIDDMHGWYHDRPVETPARDWVPAIHIQESIAVIEKQRVGRPGHIQIGGEAGA